MTVNQLSTLRVVIVTNIPTPYRNPIYRRLAEKLGYDNFHVIFCAGREANREWVLEQQGFAHTFLKEHVFERKGRYIHNNPDVIPLLRRLAPDVVITTGFNPTHLYAFGYAYGAGIAHIPMTDGTLVSERHLSIFHRIARKIVYRYSHAFIGASHGSASLYADYGLNPELFFQSHLCADNKAFAPSASDQRNFDFMFCGRFVQEKNPIFALVVASSVARALGRKVSILMVGSGPLIDQAQAYAFGIEEWVAATFYGFVQPEDLPSLYCDAKVFLFPTAGDVWGIVANESCAAGQAVLVSPLAGAAGELVIEYDNGFVLPLSLPLWVSRAANLLSDDRLLHRFSASSMARVQGYNYDEAADGLLKGVNCARKKSGGVKSYRNIILESQGLRYSVAIIQRRLTEYRVPLFERLRELLRQEKVELRLLYGPPSPGELKKKDASELIWAEKLPTRYYLDNSICWQPYHSVIKDSDLVIITQENKLISNLWPLFGYRKYRLAFWGHGGNTHLARYSSLFERFKRFTTKRVDWWFAYTGLSEKLVEDQGFPSEKITNLENSIDTLELKSVCDAVTPAELNKLKRTLNLGDGPVGLFIGSLYQEKRLDFLLDAGQKLGQRIPDFRLIVVGDGPLRNTLETAVQQHRWLRYVGRQSGRAKARFLKISNVLLNPGVVGLSIMDAFVAAIPMVTTSCDGHGPEIDYLRHGENGFMTKNSLEDYVRTVEQVLTDPVLARRLQEGCNESAQHYTIENMAKRFCDGILQALELKT